MNVYRMILIQFTIEENFRSDQTSKMEILRVLKLNEINLNLD